MSEWKGCRGLDPTFAAHVSNGMPPYLIGMESLSPQPFSAANQKAWYNHVPNKMLNEARAAGIDQNSEHENPGERPSHPALASEDVIGELMEQMGNPSRATCWEILAIALGRFVREKIRQGISLTDDMLQVHARRILYDSDDSWNQTAADNPEWLDLFKKAHGLDMIPENIGGSGKFVPEDLESYGDLGMRVPFCILLEKGVNPNDLPIASDILHQRAKGRERAMEQFTKANFASGTTYRIPQGIPGRGDYLPRTAMVVPHERAKDFATMRETTFRPGLLGQEMRTADGNAENNNFRLSTASDIYVPYVETRHADSTDDPGNHIHNQDFTNSTGPNTRPNSLLAFSTPDTVSPGQTYVFSGFTNGEASQTLYGSAPMDVSAFTTSEENSMQEMHYNNSMMIDTSAMDMNSSFDPSMNATGNIEDFDFNFDLGFDFDSGTGGMGADMDMGIR